MREGTWQEGCVCHMKDFKLHLKDFGLGTDDQCRMKSLVGYREIRQEVTTEDPVMTACNKAGTMVMKKEEIEIKNILLVESVRISG